MMNERIKLSELNGLVKKALVEAFTAPVWVIGEISDLKTNRNGHCYLTLIEKEEDGDSIIAQARATIWSYTFRMLRPFFESSTGQQLTDGLKVLLSVSVEFHELYGYSLNIRDIDPTYTLGDLARRRREIIARLQSEGVAEMNKELELPLVPQKIAIISSPTAAGYEDFVKQIAGNAGGYHFDLKLCPAIMQGNQAESSIIGALEKIYTVEQFFDAVVIIRGGGSQADLSCFDNYNLAYHITQFPLPVITGIGHEKDDSIVDLVAHTRLKTPTAVAEFLISGVTQFDLNVDSLKNQFVDVISKRIVNAKHEIEQVTRMITPLANEKISKVNSQLTQTVWKLDSSVKRSIKNQIYLLGIKESAIKNEFRNYTQVRKRVLEKTTRNLFGSLRQITLAQRDELIRKSRKAEGIIRGIFVENSYQLELSLQKAMLIDPNNILARGYSITTYNGHAIKDASIVNTNATIETRLYNGSIISEVKSITAK